MLIYGFKTVFLSKLLKNRYNNSTNFKFDTYVIITIFFHYKLLKYDLEATVRQFGPRAEKYLKSKT